MSEIRLQKYIADCGIMSRRAAEKEIEQGKVRVNGKVALIGDKVDIIKDSVEYKGKKLQYPRSNALHTYIMLNKPKGYVTTMNDEKNRKCVADLICDVGHRIYPIGRLDYESEGLLLFTDDGNLANKMMHPSGHIPKIYHVKTTGVVDASVLKNLSKPIEIDGYTTTPALCKVIKQNDNYTVVEITLFEGRNRQIRRLFEREELPISFLRRIAIGQIKLGNLAPGKWKNLSKSQIDYLKNTIKK